jgi:hypothetical protein
MVPAADSTTGVSWLARLSQAGFRDGVRRLLGVGLVVFAATAATAAEPADILARAKAASGGTRWDAVHSFRTKVTLTIGGLSGTAESLIDVRRGRFVERFELGPMKGTQGFDGTTAWSQDSSGQVRTEQGEDERLEVVNKAYRRALAFWYPEHWPAQIQGLGEREDGGRQFHVLRITPRGGRPFELWIDAATYLLDRTVEQAALETRTTILFDYRAAGDLKVAYGARSTNGEKRYDQLARMQSVEFNLPVTDDLFARPAPPLPDFAIAGGATSTTMPFELLDNHIYVDVTLDGKGPYRLACDTGGANVVTPALAAELGLSRQGALQGRGAGEKSEDVAITKVRTVEIGDATISNQVFMVLPLGPLDAAEGVPISGLIGYEVFKRFVVRLDYEHSRLTLWLPTAFAYRGTGTVVPFRFNGHIPQVEGAIDGIPGAFNIDTGARNSLSILAPFAEKHGLKARYRAGTEAMIGWGVGGAARGLLARGGVLRLGTVEVADPVMELSLQAKGAFTDPYVAGNVGAGVLKRFNITFDYGNQRLIFERNANDARRDSFDRAGIWLNQGSEGFHVVDLVAGGPAAVAGLAVGDTIVAVDGTPARELALPRLRERFRTEAPGTAVKLLLLRAGKQREVTLVLRELV